MQLKITLVSMMMMEYSHGMTLWKSSSLITATTYPMTPHTSATTRPCFSGTPASGSSSARLNVSFTPTSTQANQMSITISPGPSHAKDDDSMDRSSSLDKLE
jgi:hypothetical protein